jgi:thymidylate synthase ThyX
MFKSVVLVMALALASCRSTKIINVEDAKDGSTIYTVKCRQTFDCVKYARRTCLQSGEKYKKVEQSANFLRFTCKEASE